jgi:hypothetical protein
MCEPTPNPVNVGLELHGAKPAASTSHSNVAGASLDVRLKAAEVFSVVAAGPFAITLLGAIVSTVHDRAAEAETFWTPSTARTRNVCGPCGSELYTWLPFPHTVNAVVLSMEHWYETPGSAFV